MTNPLTVIQKQLLVKAPIKRTFEVFTSSMTTWWPKEHHIGATPFVELVVEPRVDGRWFERGTDGSESQWGRVLVWEPPTRLVLAWQLDGTFKYNPELVTEVEVRFTSLDASSTRVDFEHRNLDRFGAVGVEVGPMMDEGWGGILQSFLQAAQL
jgi:uncharacterized protein YndB with AHSA1/START domain